MAKYSHHSMFLEQLEAAFDCYFRGKFGAAATLAACAEATLGDHLGKANHAMDIVQKLEKQLEDYKMKLSGQKGEMDMKGIVKRMVDPFNQAKHNRSKDLDKLFKDNYRNAARNFILRAGMNYQKVFGSTLYEGQFEMIQKEFLKEFEREHGHPLIKDEWTEVKESKDDDN